MKDLKNLLKNKLFCIIIALWLVCGLTNYMLIMSIHKYELYICLVLSFIFGSINYFIINIYYKKYDGLEQTVNTDDLTGLLNRRAFEKDIKKVNKQSLYSIIFIDIDNFREYNNKYGHDIGDIVLKRVSEVIGVTIGHEGNAYRYGGEEIVILLINRSKDSAKKIAENIRLNVLKIHNSPYPNITISLGVSSFPSDGTDINYIIKKADDALLAAKQRGKNCTISS